MWQKFETAFLDKVLSVSWKWPNLILVKIPAVSFCDCC